MEAIAHPIPELWADKLINRHTSASYIDIQYIYIYQWKCPHFCSTVVSTNIARFLQYMAQYSQEICNIKIIHLSTLPTYCCHCTLRKIWTAHNSEFNNQSYTLPLHKRKSIQFFCMVESKNYTKCSNWTPLSSTKAWSLLHHSPVALSCAQCFARSHSKCQPSIVSDWPRLEVLSYTHDPASRPICDNQQD